MIRESVREGAGLKLTVMVVRLYCIRTAQIEL